MRRPRRRPYRLFLPSRWRKVTYTTQERAVRAAQADADGIYVVEHRDGGCWHPTLIVEIGGGAVVRREPWTQHHDRGAVAS